MLNRVRDPSGGVYDILAASVASLRLYTCDCFNGLLSACGWLLYSSFPTYKCSTLDQRVQFNPSVMKCGRDVPLCICASP